MGRSKADAASQIRKLDSRPTTHRWYWYTAPKRNFWKPMLAWLNEPRV